jgi:hypothetical protein
MDKCVLAFRLLKGEEKIDEIEGKYVIIYDQSMASSTHDNLNKAINLMADKGWRCVDICVVFNAKGGGAQYMYALMERILKTIRP